MIPQETVRKILDTAQIVDVVSDFVSLKRQGSTYAACCPFHNEKTPSFIVSPARGTYHCFGCGKHGTAVGFVMEHEALSYVEALRYLARKYGIEVQEKEETPEEREARQRSESLYLTSEFAHGFFQEQLQGAEGKAVGLNYFHSRGLEDETIRKYGLGWAPSDRQALIAAAREKGYKEEYLVDTGLVIKYDDGHTAGRFFDRVMFPIHSVSGRVIAFGGRTLRSDKTVAKYVNSPETEIYDKSRSLYGIWFAKSEIAKKDRCYLVEGYLDVLSMHQLGITNVVASSGTSLTVQQIRLIRKFTQNVTIMYDGDSAGIHAALRGIGLILKEGMNVKVVLIPDGDDPDSYSRKHTLEEVQAFIAGAEQDFIAFKTDLLLGEAGDDPLKRADLINDIADTIALIPDAVKRTTYAQASAMRFDIDVQILFTRIARTREKMLEDERKEAARKGNAAPAAAADEQAGSFAPEDAAAEVEPPVPETAPAQGYEVPLLAPCETELISLIIRYGSEPLMFETDSPYYVEGEDPWTVADFIRGAFEADSHSMRNARLRKVYDAYFQLYDESMSQEDIVRTLMDGEDREVADIVGQLSEERYQLTVSHFAASMTAQASRLVMTVPHAILVYQSKRVQLREQEIHDKLRSAGPDEIGDLLKELQEMTQIRNKIDKSLGRVR